MDFFGANRLSCGSRLRSAEPAEPMKEEEYANAIRFIGTRSDAIAARLEATLIRLGDGSEPRPHPRAAAPAPAVELEEITLDEKVKWLLARLEYLDASSALIEAEERRRRKRGRRLRQRAKTAPSAG